MPVVFEDVSFRYGFGRSVFQSFSASLPSGATVLLGPNGAGKSTLLGLAASTLRPRRGAIECLGLSPQRRRQVHDYRRSVAWMPQDIRAVPGFTVREQVAYIGWLKGMTKLDAWDDALDALEAVELASRADLKVSTLSGGQLRRLGVAQTIVHGAEVVLMDEPTAGLDPSQRSRFRELLDNLRERHANVIISTHDTADLVGSFDHVAVLAEGEMHFLGTTDEFFAHAPDGDNASRRAEHAYQSVLTKAAA